MKRTKGLKEYVQTKEYRERMGLPGQVTENYTMLAQGEYNRNYTFIHPITGKKLVLRINFGSQMHLKDQILYEYKALKLLENSGRTPKAIYADGSCQYLPYGVMVMEFLPGHSLDYKTELLSAAGCLADIHSVKMPEAHSLVRPEEPLKAILEECEAMVKTYMESELGDEQKKRRIRSLLDQGWKAVENLETDIPYHCCINTELNSTNFLVNDRNVDGRRINENSVGEKTGDCIKDNEKKAYLVDWEKPLYGDPAQDLGHFLAPTTTFWKTDVILDQDRIDAFLDTYIEKVNGRFDITGLKERTYIYIPVTCLRGITWCAMAWVQYQQPDKEIFNQSTFDKLEAYLSDEFLSRIENIWNRF